MYAKYFKRVMDFTLSLMALLVLSPVLLIRTPWPISAASARAMIKKIAVRYFGNIKSIRYRNRKI